MARRLHRGPVGDRHRVADDGGRRLRAALGRHLQPVLEGGSAAQVDVRPVYRLADRMDRARDVLLRSRAPARRVGRAESVPGRRALAAVPDAGDAAHLQPGAAQSLGRQERDPVSGDSAGEEHRCRLRRPLDLHALRHVRDLSDRREILARLHVQEAAGTEEDRPARPDAHPEAGAARHEADRRGRAGCASRSAGGADRVPRAHVRGGVGLHVELAPAAAVGARRGSRTGWPTAQAWWEST